MYLYVFLMSPPSKLFSKTNVSRMNPMTPTLRLVQDLEWKFSYRNLAYSCTLVPTVVLPDTKLAYLTLAM